MKKIGCSSEFLEDLLDLSCGGLELYRGLKKFPYTPDAKLVEGVPVLVSFENDGAKTQMSVTLKLNPEVS